MLKIYSKFYHRKLYKEKKELIYFHWESLALIFLTEKQNLTIVPNSLKSIHLFSKKWPIIDNE